LRGVCSSRSAGAAGPARDSAEPGLGLRLQPRCDTAGRVGTADAAGRRLSACLLSSSLGRGAMRCGSPADGSPLTS
jgi:hypothetical protein